MKRLFLIAALSLVAIGSFSQPFRRPNIDVTNRLTVVNEFYWQGYEIKLDSIAYIQFDGDSVRFFRVDGTYSNWIGGDAPSSPGEVGDNINFDNTTSDSEIGIIYKAGDLWLHNYEDAGSWGDNTFTGENAGNLTMAMVDNDYEASANTGNGKDVLSSLTTGWANTAGGRHSQKNVTTGHENSSWGRGSLISLIDGYLNGAWGKDALYNLIDGYWNNGGGHNAFFNAVHSYGNVGWGEDVGYHCLGDGNTYYGTFTGNSNVNGNFQILIGYDIDAVNVDNDYELNIGNMITGNTNPGLLNFNGKTNNFKGDLIISENTPSLQWTDEDGPTDGKTYRWIIANGDMYFETLNDDGTKADEVYRILKTGGVVDSMIFGDYGVRFRGDVHGVTADPGDNSTKFATTAYADAAGSGSASGADVLIDNNTPSLQWTDADGPTDGKSYRWIVANGDMYFETLLDDGTKADGIFTINQTSGIIDNLKYGSYPVYYGGDIFFDDGADRTVTVDAPASGDVNGNSLTVKGGNGSGTGSGGSTHVTAGEGSLIGASVYVYGHEQGTPGNVWLGYKDSGTNEVGSVLAKTQSPGDNTRKVATTAYVDDAVSGSGTVESVGLSVPSGFAVSGSPVTGSGVLALTFAEGYSLPTTAYQSNWNLAFGWGDHSGLYSVLAHDHSGVYEPAISSKANGFLTWDTDHWVWDLSSYALSTHSHSGYEDDLGNPSVDGYVLSSTTAGTRSWISAGSGGGIADTDDVNWSGDHLFQGAFEVQNDILLSPGATRTIKVKPPTTSGAGDDLIISAADGYLTGGGGDTHITAGEGSINGGDVLIYGHDQTNDGNVWLGYSDSGATEVGTARAKTQSSGDNSTKLATTAYVDAANGGSYWERIGTTLSTQTANDNTRLDDNSYMYFGDDSDGGISYSTSLAALALTFGSNVLVEWGADEVIYRDEAGNEKLVFDSGAGAGQKIWFKDAVYITGGLGVSATMTANEVTVGATDKVYFDGGIETYISETSADNLGVYAGGNLALTANEEVSGSPNVRIEGALTRNVTVVTATGDYYVDEADDTIILNSTTVGSATVNVRTDNTQTQEWDGRIITIKDGTGDCTGTYKIVFNPGPSAISVDGAWGMYLGSGHASVRLQYSATTGDWHIIGSFGTVTIY